MATKKDLGEKQGLEKRLDLELQLAEWKLRRGRAYGRLLDLRQELQENRDRLNREEISGFDEKALSGEIKQAEIELINLDTQQQKLADEIEAFQLSAAPVTENEIMSVVQENLADFLKQRMALDNHIEKVKNHCCELASMLRKHELDIEKTKKLMEEDAADGLPNLPYMNSIRTSETLCADLRTSMDLSTKALEKFKLERKNIQDQIRDRYYYINKSISLVFSARFHAALLEAEAVLHAWNSTRNNIEKRFDITATDLTRSVKISVDGTLLRKVLKSLDHDLPLPIDRSYLFMQ